MDTKNMFASLALVNLYEDTTVVTLGTFSFDGENAGKLILIDEMEEQLGKMEMEMNIN